MEQVVSQETGRARLARQVRRARSRKPTRADRVRQGVAAVVGLGVLVWGIQLVRGGLFVAGTELTEFVPSAPSGAARLVTDELVLLFTYSVVVLLSYFAASLVRAALDDRWLQRLGPQGGALDPKNELAEAEIDVDQSRQLEELTKQVATLSRALELQEKRLDATVDLAEKLTELVTEP